MFPVYLSIDTLSSLSIGGEVAILLKFFILAPRSISLHFEISMIVCTCCRRLISPFIISIYHHFTEFMDQKWAMASGKSYHRLLSTHLQLWQHQKLWTFAQPCHFGRLSEGLPQDSGFVLSLAYILMNICCGTTDQVWPVIPSPLWCDYSTFAQTS